MDLQEENSYMKVQNSVDHKHSPQWSRHGVMFACYHSPIDAMDRVYLRDAWHWIILSLKETICLMGIWWIAQRNRKRCIAWARYIFFNEPHTLTHQQCICRFFFHSPWDAMDRKRRLCVLYRRGSASIFFAVTWTFSLIFSQEIFSLMQAGIWWVVFGLHSLLSLERLLLTWLI